MNLLSSQKAIFTILSLTTVVFAGTMKDISSRSVAKTHVAVANAPIERYVASDVASEAVMMTLDMSQANKINGKWEIVKIISATKEVTFDKANNVDDSNKKIIVPFKLVNATDVMVNNDKSLVYNISMLSNFGTIAIFKKIGNGYEIIEAKMIKEVKKAEKALVSETKELILERALNSAKSNKVLVGNDAIGEMTLTKNSIEGLRITLSNTNGEVQNIDIAQIELKDGGSFSTEVDGEVVTGVVFANGQVGYRLNFISGPMAGAMLNFMTETEKEEQVNQMNENNEGYYDQEDKQEEVNPNSQVAEVQDQDVREVLEERQMMNEELAAKEGIVVLSQEEIKEIVETQGFSF